MSPVSVTRSQSHEYLIRSASTARLRTTPEAWTAFPTELGWVALAWRDGAVAQLCFGYESAESARHSLKLPPGLAEYQNATTQDAQQKIERYAAGEPIDLTVIPLASTACTPFTRAVQQRCRAIPFGKVVTYGELANQVGSPGGARAVGNVMRRNEVPLLIPCHRVVGTNHLGGFSAPQGLRMKERLLAMEGSWDSVKSFSPVQ